MSRYFGKYEILKKIGSGGMAEVFLARSFGAEGLEKLLVIKKILPAFATKKRFVSMFIDEAKIAVSLNHPNIVQTYDFGRVGDDYFLAMEYVDGLDLAQIQRQLRAVGGSFALGDALFLGIEICKGLDYAHRKKDKYGELLNLVHRDISPHNLLLSSEGDLKIVDFGIARARNATTRDDGMVKGKFSYMSPEQAIGGEVDARSDVFAVGVVLFELIYNRALYPFTTSEETLNLVRSAVLPDFNAINPEVPEEIERILYKALDRVPNRRYASARELQVELHKVLIATGQLHDAQTVAAFVEEVADQEPIEERTDEVDTVQHPRQGKTPSMLVTAHHLGTEPALTPSEPGRVELLRAKKDVVCVAGDLRGFAALRNQEQGERWQARLMELMRIIEAIAFKYKAVVERFSEETFLILMGLPASAENDAERAITLSYDLHEALEGINQNLSRPIEASIGVVLGRALVSRAPGARGYEKELLGEVNALAHALAREGRDGEVLVCGSIFQRVRRSFELAYLKQLSFVEDERYGKSNPSVHRVLRPKTRKELQAELSESFSVLHGRELSLKALRDRFHRVQLEQLVLGNTLSGEMGLGKTAVVEEFLRGLRSGHAQESFTLLRAFATHQQEDTSYALVRELLYDLLDLDPGEEVDELKERLEATVTRLFEDTTESRRRHILHALGYLFGIRFPGAVVFDESGPSRKHRISLALQRLLEQVSRAHPLVVVVENLHLVDALSLEFLADLMGSRIRNPLMLILTTRPISKSDPLYDRLLYHNRMRIEKLGPLSDRHLTGVIQDRLGDDPIDQVVVDYILERAAGVPFFASELADALKARGIVNNVNGRYVLGGSVGETWLPTNLEAVVAARIDELDEDLKETLRNCSILGFEFEKRDACFLFGEEIQSTLDRLVRLKWFRRGRERGEATPLRYVNMLTYEVALRELLWEERRDFHDRMASHLIEEVAAKRRKVPHTVIARHLEGALRYQEAADYYQWAAQRAYRDLSFSGALRLVNGSLRMIAAHGRTAGRGIDPFSVLLLKEGVLGSLSHHEDRLAVLNEMLRIAQEKGNTVQEIQVNYRLARYWYDQREFDRIHSLVDAIVEQASDLELFVEVAKAQKLAALVWRETGSAEEAIRLLGEANFAFDAEDDSESSAEALKLMADTYWMMGRFVDARDAYEEALSRGVSKDRDLHEAISFNLGLVQVSLGDLEDALKRYQSSLQRCREVKYLRREAAILPNLGHLYLLLGEPEKAERCLDKGVRLSRSLRLEVSLVDALATLGTLHLEMGRRKKAEQILKEAHRKARENELVYLHIHSHLGLSRLRLSGDIREVERARALAEMAINQGEQASMNHGVAPGYNLLSLALERLGRAEEALEAGQRSLRILRRFDAPDVETALTILLEQAELILRIAPQARTYEAARLLEEAAKKVQRQAEGFSSEKQRERFLDRERNRRILTLAKSISSR